MNESQILANHIANTCYEDLHDNAIQVAKKSLLDALGVMLAASTLGEGCKQFLDVALAEGSKPESTILGFGAKASAMMAAFANGSLAHALDFEDAYDGAPVHPNAATIPAALAVAEALGTISGKQFLTAIILGSDIVCRLGLALRVNPLEYGWYIPPILGAFGATAAVAKLLNLTAAQIVNAFSLTLCQATCSAELTSSPRSMVRSIRDAFAAKAGVLSTQLAKQGIVGFEQPIEGKAGLFSLYTHGNYDAAKITMGLGNIFESAKVSFKPWPSCRGTHAYIDAVLQILNEYSLDCNSIQEILVTIHPVNKMLCEPAENKQRPVTAIDAKFSIPFVIATTLVNRRVMLDQFFPDALENSHVLELARRVKYQIDSGELENSTQGYMEIVTHDQVISKRVEFPLGHPAKPISQNALIEKFRNCCQYSARKIAERNRDEVVDLILDLEHVENIGEITARL
ncbi:MAG: MmgE/PrpD family protein [Chloroflexi bacterium]|nr:MmgE/PrpD family protein [Chloroflexota bacterium]